MDVVSKAKQSKSLEVSPNSATVLKSSLSKHMPQLDAVRGIAILLVIFTHVGTSGARIESGLAIKIFDILADAGWVGVQLFFVLSGFLITGILIGERDNPMPNRFQNFYMRRILRIFPLYYGTLLCAFVLLPFFKIVPAWLEQTRDHQIWYWSFLINWRETQNEGGLGHYWSLAVEEQFYLIWPALVLSLSNRKLLLLCAAMIFSAVFFRTAIFYGDFHIAKSAIYFWTICRWDALAVGAALSIILREEEYLRWLNRWAGTIVIALILLALSVLGLTHNFKAIAGGFGLLNQTIAALLAGALVFFGLKQGGPVSLVQRVLANKALHKTGKYSYAIYVFQQPVMYVWFSTLVIYPEKYSGWQLIAVLFYNIGGVFLCSLVLALLSWRLIEGPCLSLKKYFVGAKNPSGLVSVAT